MNLTCADLDRVLESEDPALRADLERHAESCAACRERLEVWNEIEETAPLLRESWDSPDLWPRIERRLGRQPVLEVVRRKVTAPTALWLAVAAAALLVVLPFGRTLFQRPLPGGGSTEAVEKRLLTESALDEVRRSEEAYARSIDRLAVLADPVLEASDSPLVMSYREKLKLLDTAISECRARADANPFNAHLRAELLSMYQDKQRTLETVLEETQSDL